MRCTGNVVKAIKGVFLVACDEGILVQIRDKVYLYDYEFERKKFIFRLEFSWWKRLLIKYRLLERMFRTDIRAAIVWNDNLYYAVDGALWSYNLSTGVLQQEMTFRVGMRAPLAFEIIQGVKGFREQICFGEYFSNDNREEVRVWSLLDGEWKVSFEFPVHCVRHIHGLKADSFRNQVYIMTGDSDSESAIWVAKDDFKSVDKLNYGGQQSRVCQMQVRKDKILYLTDSERETNHLYCLAVENGVVSYKGKNLASFDGSIIYGCCDHEKDIFYFSTTVEPNRGGIHTNISKLYSVDKNKKLQLVFEAEKDIWPMKLFQYGCIRPCLANGKVYASIFGLKKYDGKILVFDKIQGQEE